MKVVFDVFWNAQMDKVREGLMSFITWVLQLTASMSNDFWLDPHVTSLIQFSQWVSRLAFAVAFLFMLTEAFEDKSAGKSVSISLIISNIMKATVFMEAAPILAQYSMQLCGYLIQNFDMSGQIATLNIGERLAASAIDTDTISPIIALIAVIYFLVMALKQFGVMLIQALTCVFYLPGILRGDNTEMGSWLRQTVAIVATYFFTYLICYLGIFYFVNGQLLMAIGLWLSMGMIPRILDKFGLSTGSPGGALSSVGNLAMQGISMAVK